MIDDQVNLVWNLIQALNDLDRLTEFRLRQRLPRPSHSSHYHYSVTHRQTSSYPITLPINPIVVVVVLLIIDDL